MIGFMPSFCPSNFFVKYIDAWQNSALISASTYTLTNFALGPASSKKRVYALFSWSAGSSRTLDTVMIAGVAATRLVRARSSATTNIEIWWADVSVAMGDITPTWSGSIYGFSVGIYAAFNLKDGSVYSSGTNYLSSSASTVSTTVNTLPTTFVISIIRFETASGTLTFVNLTNDTPAMTYSVFGHDFSPPTAVARTLSGTSTVATSGAMIAAVVINR